jgi:hypothetical protein
VDSFAFANRTTIPERSTTSTSGSATIRRATNADEAGGFDSPGSAARMRRHRRPGRDRER